MRPGVSSTSPFFSVTVPETGEYNSLAAFTLSNAPHSSLCASDAPTSGNWANTTSPNASYEINNEQEIRIKTEKRNVKIEKNEIVLNSIPVRNLRYRQRRHHLQREPIHAFLCIFDLQISTAKWVRCLLRGGSWFFILFIDELPVRSEWYKLKCLGTVVFAKLLSPLVPTKLFEMRINRHKTMLNINVQFFFRSLVQNLRYLSMPMYEWLIRLTKRRVWIPTDGKKKIEYDSNGNESVWIGVKLMSDPKTARWKLLLTHIRRNW